jgi:hypothetical protein
VSGTEEIKMKLIFTFKGGNFGVSSWRPFKKSDGVVG